MTTIPGPDERRVRHLLRRIGVGPDAPAEQPRRTLTPTRVIPAGQPLPTPRAASEERPTRPTPPGPPSPPTRTTPPAPPAGPPPGSLWHGPQAYGPIDIRVTLVPALPDPEPTRRDRLWAWLRTYATPLQALTGLVLALAPIWPNGYSCAATWAATVYEARSISIPASYTLATGAFALTWVALVRKRDTRREGRGSSGIHVWAVTCAFVGTLSAVSPWDIVTLITGVHP